MNFALFGRVAMLGEEWSGVLSGPAQPMIDSSGQPVREPDDGPSTTPIMLRGISVGVLQSPRDPGRITFAGVGGQVSLTVTAGRLLLSARSASHGRWAGQIRYRWISDILVRPRAGLRDNGSLRILFLDPLSPAGFDGRHYVDLSTARKIAPGSFAWDLLQRIAVDRHRWIPSGAVTDHLAVEQLLAQGPQPTKAPAGYSIPMPSVLAVSEAAMSEAAVSEAAVEPAGKTVRIESTPVVPTPGIPGIPEPPAVSPWSPRPVSITESFEHAAPLGPAAPTPGPDAAMIVMVPGVGRHAAETPAVQQPAPSPPAQHSVGVGSHRVDLDTGDAVIIDSATLFGRDPAAAAGEDVALHAVQDATLSFSKTHLLLTPSAAGISVTDRHSTNGVLVRGSGPPTSCIPGVPALLDLPATLQIGSRTMIVRAISR